MYHKMIQYDRETGDFAMHLNGELVGYAATYLQAETTLNKLVYELLTKNPIPHEEPTMMQAMRGTRCTTH